MAVFITPSATIIILVSTVRFNQCSSEFKQLKTPIINIDKYGDENCTAASHIKRSNNTRKIDIIDLLQHENSLKISLLETYQASHYASQPVSKQADEASMRKEC